MKLSLTIKQVQKLRIYIIEHNLERPLWFDSLSDSEVLRCYNGVGSDETFKPLRMALTYIYQFSIPAVLIHDVIWSYVKEKGLTEQDFYLSNKNLKKNARTCLRSYLEVYSMFYYGWCFIKAWIAERACNRLGFKSWES